MLENNFTGIDEAFEEVRRFHQTFGLPVSEVPHLLSGPRTAARAGWMQEEVSELLKAGSIEEQVDAVLDLMYLALGCLAEMGVRPGIPLTYVHRTNLEKRWPGGEIRVDPEGKIVKPPGWTGPRAAISQYLADVRMEHIARPDDPRG